MERIGDPEPEQAVDAPEEHQWRDEQEDAQQQEDADDEDEVFHIVLELEFQVVSGIGFLGEPGCEEPLVEVILLLALFDLLAPPEFPEEGYLLAREAGLDVAQASFA